VFNVTAMERSILAELSERGGRGQLSRLKDRRPLERLVNKGFVERHVLKGQQEEYVLTAIGQKVRSRSGLPGRAPCSHRCGARAHRGGPGHGPIEAAAHELAPRKAGPIE
jgi:hypothetical protein